MTPRKRAGVRFESWIDRQVRTARERGEFDPELNLAPFNVERIVGEWRRSRG